MDIDRAHSNFDQSGPQEIEVDVTILLNTGPWHTIDLYFEIDGRSADGVD